MRLAFVECVVIQDPSGRALGVSQRHSDEQAEVSSGKLGTRYASRPDDLNVPNADALGDTTNNKTAVNVQSSSSAPAVNNHFHASPKKNMRRSIFDKITSYIRSS
jgi:hypothetical protein